MSRTPTTIVAVPSIPGRDAVRARVADLLQEIARIPRERIADGATVDGDLAMQSIDFVELQVAIEDEYRIEIDPIRVVELNEFGAIVDYVCEQIAGTA